MALRILRAIFFKFLIPSVRLVLPPFFLLFSKPRSSESPTHPKLSPLDPAKSPRSESSGCPKDYGSPADHQQTRIVDTRAFPHPARRAPVGSGRVGKWRVTFAGTFPQTPLRTGLDTFASSGSPELICVIKVMLSLHGSHRGTSHTPPVFFSAL